MSERPVVPSGGQLIQPPVALKAGMEAAVDSHGAVAVDLAELAPLVALDLAGLALVRRG